MQYPFLMHASLALAALHDRYLGTPTAGRPALLATYHWSQCTALFNQQLRRPIQPQDRDAVWATAASLGAITFASVDAASSPEAAWPLKEAEPSDLEWIRISEGKMALWHLTDPLRAGSVFRAMSHVYAQLFSPLPVRGIDGLPPALSSLCNLDASSSADSNPFFTPVHALSRLLATPGDQITLSIAILFMGHMKKPFTAMLQARHPVALLLLAMWYARARQAVWWIELRARVECPSICLYLRRFHKENGAVQDLLPCRVPYLDPHLT